MVNRPLWRCPNCGQTFVGRNMPHSCQVRTLDDFFARADPALRALFERFAAAAAERGPVTVNVTKSRIAIQARGRFAGIDLPRRDHLVANFLLTRPVRSERLLRVDHVPPYYYVHRLRLADPGDIDAELREWLGEAYQVGEQRHVRDPGWPKVTEPPGWVRVP
jgi:Domain of unknown function (DUF5655)